MKRLAIGFIALVAFSQPPQPIKILMYNPNTQQSVYATLGPGLALINGALTVTIPASTVPNFADGEAPVGAVDGTNATFTLAHAPSPVASMVLTRGPLWQFAGIDYTIAGQTLTFINGATPQAGDSLRCWYRY